MSITRGKKYYGIDVGITWDDLGPNEKTRVEKIRDWLYAGNIWTDNTVTELAKEYKCSTSTIYRARRLLNVVEANELVEHREQKRADFLAGLQELRYASKTDIRTWLRVETLIAQVMGFTHLHAEPEDRQDADQDVFQTPEDFVNAIAKQVPLHILAAALEKANKG